MLAFPMAIATYEFLAIANQYRQGQAVSPYQHQRWLAPALDSLSFLGWVALFNGFAPADAIAAKSPMYQKELWPSLPTGRSTFSPSSGPTS